MIVTSRPGLWCSRILVTSTLVLPLAVEDAWGFQDDDGYHSENGPDLLGGAGALNGTSLNDPITFIYGTSSVPVSVVHDTRLWANPEPDIIWEGDDFIGATLTAVPIGAAQSVSLSIIDIQRDADAADVYWHVVQQDGVPLCGLNGVDPIPAVPIFGTWDGGEKGSGAHTTRGLTFACKGAAVAKCISQEGYRPYVSWNHHNACVRMLRADYCGTGVPHTVGGTPITMVDGMSPAPIHPQPANWDFYTGNYRFEAIWSANGAVCTSAERLAEIQAFYTEPPCDPLPQVCSADPGFSDGVRLLKDKCRIAGNCVPLLP